MKVEAKMVPVADPSLTLADVPVWTSCKVSAMVRNISDFTIPLVMQRLAGMLERREDGR